MMKRLFACVCLFPALALGAEFTTRPLSELAVYPRYRVNAAAEPMDEAQLGMAVSGRIASLPVREGERVQAGQTLVTLDDREFRIEAARAKAQVNLVASQIRLAQSQLEQTEALAKQEFVSPDALRIRKTELAVRRSELAAVRQARAAADLALERTILRAPFDGVVKSRLASLGDYAMPGAPVLVLAATTSPEIHARVPVAQIVDLRTAGRWTLHAAGLEVPLKLQRVSPLVDRAAQAQDVIFAAQIDIPIGLAGEIRWQGTQPQLPPDYVQRRDGQYGVFVMRGDAPEFRALPGAQPGRPVTVPASLSADTPIVDEGRFQIGLMPAESTEAAESSKPPETAQ